MSDINPIGRPEMNGVHANRSAQARSAQPTQQASPQRPDDQVQLSEHARMLSKLGENPIRQDLVDRVRSELAQGTYETQGKLNQALEELGKDLG